MTRFDGDWSVLIQHILTGTLFLILAAVQFSPELRARNRTWHRGSGKIAMLAGVLAGLSGIWLIAGYPPGPLTTPQLEAVRIAAGTALAAFVLLAFGAIRRRHVATHRALMVRAFALSIAGKPQALLILAWTAAGGVLTPQIATGLICLGFALAIAVGEACIRAPHLRPIHNPSTG